MGREFILPDLGEGLTEAEIVAWLVQPGDEVAIDQPVVELESAKSVVQLPTPFAGVVESLGGEIGEVLHAGSVLMTLAPVGAAAPDAAAAPASESATSTDERRRRPRRGTRRGRARVAVPTEAATEESGAVLIGYGTRATTATKRAASAPARFGRRTAGRRRLGRTPRPRPLRRASIRAVAPPSSRRSCAGSRASTASTRASSTDPAPTTSCCAATSSRSCASSRPVLPSPARPRAAPERHGARAGARRRRRCRGIRRRSRAATPRATVACRWIAWAARPPRTSRGRAARSPRRRCGWTSTRPSSSPRVGSCRRPRASASASPRSSPGSSSRASRGIRSLNSSFDAERDELVVHGGVNLGHRRADAARAARARRARRRADVAARPARRDRRTQRGGRIGRLPAVARSRAARSR